MEQIKTSLFVLGLFLSFLLVKANTVPEKLGIRAKRDVMQGMMVFAIDRFADAKSTIEHGVKVEDKSSRGVDLFGAKFKTENNHELGAGDAMRTDDDERRKRDTDSSNLEADDMNKSENVFTKIFKEVVETGKNMIKSIQEQISGEQKREY